jgi:hypothetical protein
MQAIAESESTKMRNLGHDDGHFARQRLSIGDSDPTVFFVVVKDNTTCKECYAGSTLMPDGSHYAKALEVLSAQAGLPQARRGQWPRPLAYIHTAAAHLTYLSKGFGFQRKWLPDLRQ